MAEPPRLKFYFDTHISKAVAVQLRLRGVDVLRCEEVGMAEASDGDHLAFATQEGRVMVSLDKDFPRIHDEWMAAGLFHCGIMKLNAKWQGEDNIGAIMKALLTYYELIEAEAGTLEDDIENQLLFVN